MADETEQMIWQGNVWCGRFAHRSYCRYTTGHSPFGFGSILAISLTKLRNLVWMAGQSAVHVSVRLLGLIRVLCAAPVDSRVFSVCVCFV